MTFKDRGIVLKETAVKESDKQLVLLLEKRGKTLITAKGARKLSSKFSAATELFCYSEFIIYDGGNFLSLAQSEQIRNFFGIRNDYEMFVTANLFLEMADKMILPEMETKEALELLLRVYNRMDKKVISPRLASIIFQIKFLQTEGLSPSVDSCVKCGRTASGPAFYKTGIICGGCRGIFADTDIVLPISESSVYTIQYILNSEIKDLFQFNLAEYVIDELCRIVDEFRNYNCQMAFKSLELL